MWKYVNVICRYQTKFIGCGCHVHVHIYAVVPGCVAAYRLAVDNKAGEGKGVTTGAGGLL